MIRRSKIRDRDKNCRRLTCEGQWEGGILSEARKEVREETSRYLWVRP